MTDRINGTPDEILTSVVSRIQGQVSELNNAGRCFIALNPDQSPAPATGDFFAVVSPTSGTFGQAMLDGGASNQCTVETGVIVRIYSTAQLDPAKHDGIFLTSAARGILKVATKVVKALTAWSPITDAEFTTRDPLLPSSYTIGRNNRNLGYIELDFRVSFDWDLT